MKTIICIRHGMTAGNLQRRYIGGGTDEPLCAEGKAALAAYAAAGLYPPAARVVISPMLRCAETAELLYPAIAPEAVEGFREMCFGQFEGLTFDEINCLPGQELFGSDEAHMIFPGGEDAAAFDARCAAAFAALLSMVDSTAALIVHGGVLMAIMRRLFGGSLYDYQVKNGRGFLLTEANGAWQYQILGE